MVSFESAAYFPDQEYTCKQISSYDRRSVSPDQDFWFANGDFGKMMRNIILKITFDGKETVWVPLSDFSGAGFGSPKVESWYMSADGKGRITCRWVMPYQKQATV